MVILVADDTESKREQAIGALKTIYPHANFLCTCTGEETQRLIKKGLRPDLIICDEHFDDYDESMMSGSDFVRWLRVAMANKTPVVLYTSDLWIGERLKQDWNIEVVHTIAGLCHTAKAIVGRRPVTS